MIGFLHTPTPGSRAPVIERALNVEDMADAYRSSPKTIRALCRAGRIPGAFKTALGWRISATHWASFLTSQTTGAFVSTRVGRKGTR